MKGNREQFGSRLGFLLVSAGCAIGIGNVWRFPYITGKYGGAAFVLMYLIFLVIMGLPILTMELSIGRAAKKSIGQAHPCTGTIRNVLASAFLYRICRQPAVDDVLHQCKRLDAVIYL